MVFKMIEKNEVMNFYGDGDLYLLRVSKRSSGKYCSSKQVNSLTVKEIADAIKDDRTAFILIKEEEA